MGISRNTVHVPWCQRFDFTYTSGHLPILGVLDLRSCMRKSEVPDMTVKYIWRCSPSLYSPLRLLHLDIMSGYEGEDTRKFEDHIVADASCSRAQHP